MIVLIIYQFPRRFNKEIQAYEIIHHMDNKESEITIKIEGWYSKGLLRSDKFMGKIYIEGHEMLIQEYIKVSDDFSQNTLLAYHNDQGSLMSFAFMYNNEDFDEILIYKFDHREDGSMSIDENSGSILVGPAKSKAAALDLIEKNNRKTHFKNISLLVDE
jgi:hypothetical protein